MNIGKNQKALIEKWWSDPNSDYILKALWDGGDKLDNQYPIYLVRMHTINHDFDRECIISWSKSERGCIAKINAIEAYVAELDGKWLESRSARKESEAQQ